MKKQLEALARREISFDGFARSTSKEWDKLAAYLHNPWRRNLPLTVTVEDIRQELLMHAWQAVGKYDPARGTTLKKFVIFNACSKTLRYIHTQRNSLRRSDKAESRAPVALSTLHETDDWAEAILCDTSDPGELIDFKWRFEKNAKKAEGMDRHAIKAFRMASGNIQRAATFLNDALGEDWCVFNNWTENNAVKQVEQTISACALA